MIEAHQENEKEEWERVRVLAYITAKFGNTDPKKFPRTHKKFMPYPWDDKEAASDPKEIVRQHALMKAMRNEIINKQKHG